MKINEEKLRERMKSVKPENRVYIYDAQIIIEFLHATFMPLHYFLNPDGVAALERSVELEKKFFKSPIEFHNKALRIQQMYDYYLLFRQAMPYTAPIETLWRFRIIVKKLRWRNNGWQFGITRRGVDRFWYASPAVLRSSISAEEKMAYPVPGKNVEESQVEMKPEDYKDEAEDDPTFDDPAETVYEPLPNLGDEVRSESQKFIEKGLIDVVLGDQPPPEDPELDRENDGRTVYDPNQPPAEW